LVVLKAFFLFANDRPNPTLVRDSVSEMLLAEKSEAVIDLLKT